jgi:DNA-binding LacI/PurR family transcriptional regulator
MPVTLDQIARKAKLSVPSVSRALSGHPTMSARTIERVQAIGRQLGYQSPRGWNKQQTQRVRRVTFVMVDVDDLSGAAMAHAAQSENLRVELRAIHSADSSEGIIAQLREMATECDALMLYGHLRYAELAALSVEGIPFVMLGNPLADGTYSQPAGIVVASDYIEMGRVATRRLIDRGHRRIAFVGGPMMPGMWYDSWLKGYWLAHREAGLTPDLTLQITALTLDRSERMAEMKSRLNQITSPPTAAVLTDDVWSPLFLELMRERFAIAPHDLTFGARSKNVQGRPLEQYPLVVEDIDAMIDLAFTMIRLPLDGAPYRSARILLPHNN